jgi:hypothetical protein
MKTANIESDKYVAYNRRENYYVYQNQQGGLGYTCDVKLAKRMTYNEWKDLLNRRFINAKQFEIKLSN